MVAEFSGYHCMSGPIICDDSTWAQEISFDGFRENRFPGKCRHIYIFNSPKIIDVCQCCRVKLRPSDWMILLLEMGVHDFFHFVRSLFINDPSFKNKIDCIRSQNYRSLFKNLFEKIVCSVKVNRFFKKFVPENCSFTKNRLGFFPIFSTIFSFSFFKFIQTILNRFFFKSNNFLFLWTIHFVRPSFFFSATTFFMNNFFRSQNLCPSLLTAW